MNASYESLSIIPGYKIDTETGELSPVQREVGDRKTDIKLIISDSIDDKINYIARQVTGNYGENIIRDLLRKLIFNKNKIIDKNFDILLKSGDFGETKTGRIGNVCVIIKDQLEKMPSGGYYFLVYYKINGFETASKCLKHASENLNISPETYLKRNIKVSKIYIFPKSDMVWHYNKSPKIQRKIQSTKGKFRIFEYSPFKLHNAIKIFSQNPGNHEQFHFCFGLDKETNIEVFSSGLDIKL